MISVELQTVCACAAPDSNAATVRTPSTGTVQRRTRASFLTSCAIEGSSRSWHSPTYSVRTRTTQSELTPRENPHSSFLHARGLSALHFERAGDNPPRCRYFSCGAARREENGQQVSCRRG